MIQPTWDIDANGRTPQPGSGRHVRLVDVPLLFETFRHPRDVARVWTPLSGAIHGDKSPVAWSYWERLQEMVAACGPYSIVANKTRLGFMVRVRFAGMSSVSDRGMSVGFWLKERIDSPRFRKVEYLGGRDWIYQLRVTTLDDLDEEVQAWLCMAYEVGCQRA